MLLTEQSLGEMHPAAPTPIAPLFRNAADDVTSRAKIHSTNHAGLIQFSHAWRLYRGSRVRGPSPSCVWTLGAPLNTLQHPAFHQKVQRFEEKRCDEPKCIWFVVATHTHHEPRRQRINLIKHERPCPIEKCARGEPPGSDQLRRERIH